MSVSKAYTLIVNNQFAAVLMTGTIIATVLVFMMLYYYYVEKTKLVKYVASFFGSSLLGLLSNSFMVLETLGRDYGDAINIYIAIGILAKYLTALSLFLFLLYLSEVFYRRLMNVLFGVMVLFNVVTYFIGQQLVFMLIYCIGVMIIAVVIMLQQENVRLAYFAIGGMLIFTLLYFNERIGANIYNIQWVIDLSIAFFAVKYFMNRYKIIYRNKNHLYERLAKDPLTHAYSRTYFLTHLEKIQSGVVMFIDINKFKLVNDIHGHVAGDQLLKLFASRMIDMPEIIFCRFGGDEFTLCTKTQDDIAIHEITEMLIRTFQGALDDIEHDISEEVGISIGVKKFDDYDGVDALSLADALMYRAKEKGNYLVNYAEEGLG